MIYVPDVKSLVYGELQFISTAVPVKAPVISMDAIIDEVSREIFDLFISEEAAIDYALNAVVETRN